MIFNVNLIASGKCGRIVYLKKPTTLNVSLKKYLYCYKTTFRNTWKGAGAFCAFPIQSQLLNYDIFPAHRIPVVCLLLKIQ